VVELVRRCLSHTLRPADLTATNLAHFDTAKGRRSGRGQANHRSHPVKRGCLNSTSTLRWASSVASAGSCDSAGRSTQRACSRQQRTPRWWRGARPFAEAYNEIVAHRQADELDLAMGVIATLGQGSFDAGGSIAAIARIRRVMAQGKAVNSGRQALHFYATPLKPRNDFERLRAIPKNWQRKEVPNEEEDCTSTRAGPVGLKPRRRTSLHRR
jgi:hypothetical protein